MNKKLLESIATAVLLAVGVVYLYTSLTMGNTQFNTSLPPGYFPTMVGVLWVFLCVPALVKSVRQIKDCKDLYEINNFDLLLLTVAGIVIYLVMWSFVRIFYPATFLFLAYLFMLYTDKEKRKNSKQIIFNLILSAGITLLIYLLFGMLLHVRF